MFDFSLTNECHFNCFLSFISYQQSIAITKNFGIIFRRRIQNHQILGRKFKIRGIKDIPVIVAKIIFVTIFQKLI